jgi:2'-phosphotransferase
MHCFLQRSEPKPVRISKALSYLLRHGAVKEGLLLTSDGFIDVSSILENSRFTNVTVDEIRSIVESSDKQRFALRTDPSTGNLQIRANQGHSFEVRLNSGNKIAQIANIKGKYT